MHALPDTEADLSTVIRPRFKPHIFHEYLDANMSSFTATTLSADTGGRLAWASKRLSLGVFLSLRVLDYPLLKILLFS